VAERLIRLFSFAGDIVLDPFVGCGSTCLAAIYTGRNSIGVEIEREYLLLGNERIQKALFLRKNSHLFDATVETDPC
jgi:DNA modification methylase